MFKTRFISSIVLVIVFAAALFIGGNVLWCLTLAISLIGMFELNRVLKNQKNALGIISYGICVIYYLCLILGENHMSKVVIESNYFEIISLAFLLGLLAVYVFTYPKYTATDIGMTFLGFFYVAVMLSFIYKIRMVPEVGQYLVWLVFICSWVSDTCAYCVGSMIGKRKLAPVLSPKKSVEGSLGGIIGSMIVGAIYGYFLQGVVVMSISPVIAMGCIGGIGAIISQVGDLAASAIKRNYDVKDYGNLIPGHGGILDRFDSVIATAPIIFLYFVLAA